MKRGNKMKKSMIITVVMTILSCGLLLAPQAMAIPFGQEGVEGGVLSARGANQPTDLFGDGGIFNNITNLLLFIIGVLSVIMLIIGGIRYVISGGNQQAITSAKNTILYAIVGLIIAILSFAIINFVVGAFSNGYGGGTRI